MKLKQLYNTICRYTLFITILFIQSNIVSAQNPIGLFDNHEDVGDPKLKGSAVFNKEDCFYK